MRRSDRYKTSERECGDFLEERKQEYQAADSLIYPKEPLSAAFKCCLVAYGLAALEYWCSSNPAYFRLWAGTVPPRVMFFLERFDDSTQVDREYLQGTDLFAQFMFAPLAAGLVPACRPVFKRFCIRGDRVDRGPVAEDLHLLVPVVKALVLGDFPQAVTAAETFKGFVTRRKKMRPYMRQADVLLSLARRNTEAFDEALASYLRRYGAISRGHFMPEKDEMISFHGLSYLNIARFYGMDVKSPSERWCPSDLLV